MPPEIGGTRRLPGLVGSTGKIEAVKQWWHGKSLALRIGLGVAIYILFALGANAVFGYNACAVLVDGKRIAVVESEQTARQVYRDLVNLYSEDTGSPVVINQQVAYRGTRAAGGDLIEPAGLREKLMENLIFKTVATAVIVDGRTEFTFIEDAQAEELLAWLKSVYPVDPEDTLEFKEEVELVKTEIDVRHLDDLAGAKKKVLLGTSQEVTYTVKQGDTLWDIARASNVDMDQIVFTNPGLKPERLSIGQVLHLSREAPLITVMATRVVTSDEKIPYKVEIRKDNKLLYGERKVITRGVPGETKVTYKIVRENGLEVNREVLKEEVVSEPSTEVVAQGSLTLLASRGGDGRLMWPSSGGVLSPFGMRGGRMHQGIDIGGRHGSPVVAAAGGTVIYTGWKGGYGNTVDISHGSGLVTRYAHLSAIRVSNGQTVERGQLIGLLGATGNTTGPHLHFETIVGGAHRNPLNYL